MKKGLIFLLGIVSFLGINTVSAEEKITITHFYNHFEEYVSDYNEYKENIDQLISFWEENYSSVYPYYVVWELLNGGYASSTGPTFYLAASTSNTVYSDNVYLYYESNIVFEYDSTTDSYNYNSSSASTIFNLNIGSNFYTEKQALISNGLVYTGSIDYLIPTYVSTSLNLTIEEIKLKSGINYPTIMDLYNGTYDYNIDDLATELELEDVLSSPLEVLKDVKDTIVNIFDIITEFISLLPETMKTFLYVSFTVAIVLGLLKLIL